MIGVSIKEKFVHREEKQCEETETEDCQPSISQERSRTDSTSQPSEGTNPADT